MGEPSAQASTEALIGSPISKGGEPGRSLQRRTQRQSEATGFYVEDRQHVADLKVTL